MHFGVFAHVSRALMLRLIPIISLSLPSLWLCLDNQFSINSTDPGFTWPLCCIDGCATESSVTYMKTLVHPSWRLPSEVWDVLSHWLHGRSSSGGTCLIQVIFLEFLFQCCCTRFLHWWLFFANAIGHGAVSSCASFFVNHILFLTCKDLLLTRHLKNPFLGRVAHFYYRT